MLLVRKDMETAILIVSQNLFKERVKMSASYVIATYSTVGNILSCLTAGGANLTPQLVNAIASICSSGCNVALMELESTGDVMEPESTGNGRRIRQTLGALDGTLEEVGRRGLMFPTDLDFKFIRAYNNLALAVLRGEDLEMGKRKLKKEEARENLWQALERIDELTGTGKVTDNTADGELERIKDDIAAAMEILDISLDSEATTKPIKVAGAGLSLAASIAGTIATFGTGAPVAIVPAVPVP
jgi:hypothetical protein